MTMLVQALFAQPLDRAARGRVRLAVAGLAHARAVRIDRHGRSATIAGEWLGTAAVRAALTALDVPPTELSTGLTPEEDARCDDTAPGERLRPAGR
jgi:hypothetical protein